MPYDSGPQITESDRRKALRRYINEAKPMARKNLGREEEMTVLRKFLKVISKNSGMYVRRDIPGFSYFSKRYGDLEKLKWMAYTIYPDYYQASLEKNDYKIAKIESETLTEVMRIVAENNYHVPRRFVCDSRIGKLGGVKRVEEFSESLFPKLGDRKPLRSIDIVKTGKNQIIEQVPPYLREKFWSIEPDLRSNRSNNSELR